MNGIGGIAYRGITPKWEENLAQKFISVTLATPLGCGGRGRGDCFPSCYSFCAAFSKIPSHISKALCFLPRVAGIKLLLLQLPLALLLLQRGPVSIDLGYLFCFGFTMMMVSYTYNRWLISFVPFGPSPIWKTLILLLCVATLIKLSKPSIVRINKKGDKKSPCLNPFSDVKYPTGPPFARTKYLTVFI